MRIGPQPIRWPLLPVLLGVAVLAACDAVTAPDRAAAPQVNGPTASSIAPSTSGGSAMVPFTDRESFSPAGGWTAPTAPYINCGAFGILPATYIGTGVMSHLGRVTTVATWQTCSTDADGHMMATGTATSTGANGDAIQFTFTQVFLVHTLSYSSFVLDATITSGTGRFAGASGTAEGGGDDSISEGWGSWAFQGTITAPGAGGPPSP